MKLRTVLLVVVIISSCSQPSNNDESNVDTVATESDLSQATSDPVEEPVDDHPKIEYSWADGYNQERRFEPFDSLYNIAQLAMQFRDSVYMAHSYTLTAADSALSNPIMDKAYEAILQYGEKLKAGARVSKGILPVRNGVLEPEDESFNYLHETKSHTLDITSFAFIGGAPFIQQDPDLYKDASGNPETHYLLQQPENASFFFNYVYSFNLGPMELSYGPPLQVYDGTPRDIHGIGSITHHLKNRIPVWFFTSGGAVPATLISVNLRLGEEYGCVSNNPSYVFACSKNISPEEIMGVFYANSTLPMDKAVSNREAAPYLWEFDIDGDGHADLARIESTFFGIQSDTMMMAIWYVRRDNTWMVLDYAAEPECT